jgi:diguanylate cyclase (GGDEF)-like protein
MTDRPGRGTTGPVRSSGGAQPHLVPCTTDHLVPGRGRGDALNLGHGAGFYVPRSVGRSTAEPRAWSSPVRVIRSPPPAVDPVRVRRERAGSGHLVLLVGVLLAGAGVFGAAATAAASGPPPAGWRIALGWGLLVLGARWPLQLRRGSESVVFSGTDAALVAGLALLPLPWLLIGVAGAELAVHALAGGSAVKTWVNAAITTLVAAVAGGVIALGAAAPLERPATVSTLGWLALAVLLGTGLGDVLVAAAIATAGRTPTSRASVTDVLRDGAGLRLMTITGNIALGCLAVGLAGRSPATLALLPFTLVGLYAAYLGRLRARAESELWRQLATATTEWSGLDARAVGPVAATRAAALFRADWVELRIRATESGEPPTVYRQGDPAGGSGSYVQSPLASHGLEIGLLRLGFAGQVRLSDREQAALSTFAAALATVLDNSRQHARRRHSDDHDPLTGLRNRRALTDEVAGRLAAGGAAARFTLLVVELDRFRLVNEALGTGAGDVVLREVARRLRRHVRTGDTVARLGGDAYAILLADLTDPADARSVAGGLTHVVSDPMTVHDLPVSVEARLGTATPAPGGLGSAGVDAAELLRRAEVAARSSRLPGVLTVYERERDAPDAEPLALAADLRAAIEGDQLRLHYQLKYDLRSAAFTGAEALARWKHPTRGFVPPGLFVPVVEQSGLVRPFTARVLDLAVAECRQWPPDCSVAVNLSARNLLDPELPQQVRRTLDRYGLDPGRLVLELTETAVLLELDVADRALEAVRALGVRVSVDDFGTGYSSLTFLSRQPVDELKVDRTFVSALLDSPADAAIVRATIRLAHDLGLPVVAEGVETPEQLAALRELGCDVVQGYLLARPLPAPEVRPLLGRRTRTLLPEQPAAPEHAIPHRP